MHIATISPGLVAHEQPTSIFGTFINTIVDTDRWLVIPGSIHFPFNISTRVFLSTRKFIDDT